MILTSPVGLHQGFSRSLLILEDGFQLLHAVHAVETFLANLRRRKANFHIAFFEEHAQWSIPGRASSENRNKYDLFRAVVIRHLQANLPKSQPSIRIAQFASYQDPEFMEYMNESGLYFLMCHDGSSTEVKLAALPDDMVEKTAKVSKQERTKKPLKTSAATERQRRQAFRKMIFWFVMRGINVALTNSVAWHDTKVSLS